MLIDQVKGEADAAALEKIREYVHNAGLQIPPRNYDEPKNPFQCFPCRRTFGSAWFHSHPRGP
jgi:hypothetical protein